MARSVCAFPEILRPPCPFYRNKPPSLKILAKKSSPTRMKILKKRETSGDGRSSEAPIPDDVTHSVSSLFFTLQKVGAPAIRFLFTTKYAKNNILSFHSTSGNHCRGKWKHILFALDLRQIAYRLRQLFLIILCWSEFDFSGNAWNTFWAPVRMRGFFNKIQSNKVLEKNIWLKNYMTYRGCIRKRYMPDRNFYMLRAYWAI